MQLPVDLAQLVDFNKRNIKARIIILDAIKDHVFPHVTENKFSYKMWESLVTLPRISNENRKMMLKQKLRNTKMTNIDTVTSYLTNITQLRDDLAMVGYFIPRDQLVRMTLDVFPKQWDGFIDSIMVR